MRDKKKSLNSAVNSLKGERTEQGGTMCTLRGGERKEKGGRQEDNASPGKIKIHKKNRGKQQRVKQRGNWRRISAIGERKKYLRY